MLVLGLTGGIASGKSFVSNYLKEKGCVVFDADAEVHRLLSDSNSIVFQEVKETFPESFIDGKIDRKKLGEIVFVDKGKLRKLEDVIHPRLTEIMHSFLEVEKKSGETNNKNNQKIIVLDAPLLFEAGWDKYCDYTILLELDKKLQKERYVGRGEEGIDRFDAIMNNQKIPQNNSNKTSDFFVNTGLDKEDVLERIDRILQRITQKTHNNVVNKHQK